MGEEIVADKSEFRRAFSEIMNEFGPGIYRYALSLTGNEELANDIYQQTFLLLLEKKPKFTHRAQLNVWLMRCARKTAAAERRRADNSRTVSLNDAGEQGEYDAGCAELYDYLSVLKEKYREVTVLFYIEDMSIKDISEILKISTSAVKTRLSRARDMLKKIYEEELS